MKSVESCFYPSLPQDIKIFYSARTLCLGMVELVKQEAAVGTLKQGRVKGTELSEAPAPSWLRLRTWEGTTMVPATAVIREARLDRDSHRAQAIREVLIASRAITVAAAVATVLQEVTAGTYSPATSKIHDNNSQSSRGGGSSAYNPPREPSYSNSYGGGGGAVNSSTATNYGSNFGASTTNYSPYTGSSNSYSSTSNNKSSSQPGSNSNYSSSAATTSTGPSNQFSAESGSTAAKTGSSYDSTQTSSSAGTYGGVGQSSSSSVSSLGLSANSTLSSASKMSVNTTSGKMVPGMPPGVPGVLPAQYMIGANAAAGEKKGHHLESSPTLKHTIQGSLPIWPTWVRRRRWRPTEVTELEVTSWKTWRHFRGAPWQPPSPSW